jgi:hypothetical protein
MVRLAHRTVRLAFAGALLSLASVATLPPAAAGQYTLDAAIPQKLQVTGADEAEMQRWADDNIQALTSGDPERIDRAKDALSRPLRDGQATVAFRLEASRRLAPALRQAMEGAGADVAVNAAIVAGDLGSEAGLELLRQLRNDERLAVRYRAIKGYGMALMLADQAQGGAAFNEEAAQRVVRELGEGLKAETEPLLLVAFVTSLEQASAGSRFPGLRDRALQALASAVGARLSKLNGTVADGAEVDPLVRGLIHTRGQMIRVRNPVAPDAQRAAVEASGHIVAWGFRFARANNRLPDPENPGEADLHRTLLTGVNTAIQTLTLVAPARQQEIEALGLPAAIRNGDVQGFLRGAGQLIGEGGILTQSPFSVPARTFRLQ